jgi:hypothetical protein
MQKKREEEAKKTHPSNLAGYWRDSTGSRYLFKVTGNSFKMTRVMACWNPPLREWDTCSDLRPDNTLFLFGTIDNDRLSGYGVNTTNFSSRRVIRPDGTSFACPVAAGNYPIIRSEIGADGTHFKVSYADTPQSPNCPPMQWTPDYRREQ